MPTLRQVAIFRERAKRERYLRGGTRRPRAVLGLVRALRQRSLGRARWPGLVLNQGNEANVRTRGCARSAGGAVRRTCRREPRCGAAGGAPAPAQRAGSIAAKILSRRSRSGPSTMPDCEHHATSRSPAVPVPPGAALWKRSRNCLTCSASRSAASSGGHSRPSSISSSRSISRRASAPFSIRARWADAAASSAVARETLRRDGPPSPSPRRRAMRAAPSTGRSQFLRRRWIPRASAPRPSSSSHRRSFAASACHTAASRTRAREASAASSALFALRNRASTPRAAGSEARAVCFHCSCRSRRPRRSSCRPCPSPPPGARVARRSPPVRATALVLVVVLLPALRLARLEDGVARCAKLLPERALVALRERQLLRLRLPSRLYRLHLRWRVALGRPGGQRRRLVDQCLAGGLRLIACRGQRVAHRCERSPEFRVEALPRLGLDAAEVAAVPRVVRFPQPALDRAPIARLGEQRRRMCRGGCDELLAQLARLFAQRRLLGEMAGSGRRPVRRPGRSVPTTPSGPPRTAGRGPSIRCAASAPRSRAAVRPA